MSKGAADTEVLDFAAEADTRADAYSFDALSPEAFLSLGAMEGLYTPIVESAVQVDEAARRRDVLWPGYLFAAAAAASAFLLHYVVLQRVSALIIAIIVGVVIRNLLPLPSSAAAGCKRIVKKVIPWAIVLTGAGLNLVHLSGVGLSALAITVVCVGLAIGGAYYCGRMFGLGERTALLIGAGTGICGNSAIVAVAPLIDADDEDLVLSIGTVNLFGLLAMLLWPLLGGLFQLSDDRFGVWSGTTIHAVPQVVAAGFAYSEDAGTLATLVKLVRVALLAPMMVVLGLLYARRHSTPSGPGNRMIIHYARLVPVFVWAFVAMALLNTLGLLPTLSFHLADFFPTTTPMVDVSMVEVFKNAGKMLLTLAMAAIGLEVDVRRLAGVGRRAISTGLLVTIALAGASLTMVTLLI